MTRPRIVSSSGTTVEINTFYFCFYRSEIESEEDVVSDVESESVSSSDWEEETDGSSDDSEEDASE